MAAKPAKLKGHLKFALSVGFAFVPIATLVAVNSRPEVLQAYRDLKERSFKAASMIAAGVESAVSDATAKHDAKERKSRQQSIDDALAKIQEQKKASTPEQQAQATESPSAQQLSHRQRRKDAAQGERQYVQSKAQQL
jgi:hypothetical protein